MPENVYKPHVLYIGSNESALNSAIEYLEENYEVNVDASRVFSEGIKKAAQCSYDAIVSDVMHLDSDALKTFKEMRETGLYTPLIAACCSAEADLFSSRSDSFADFYLSTSQNLETLHKQLYKYINKSVELAKKRNSALMSLDILPLVWNNSPDALLLIDNDTKRISGYNPAFVKLFGILDTEKVRIFDLNNDPNIDESFKQSLVKGGHEIFEMDYDFEKIRSFGVYKTSKKGRMNLEVRFIPLNEDDVCKGTMMYIRDITDLKISERQLSEANKKLSLLSGITRHDVLNQISAVRLYAELLSETAGADEKALNYLKAIDGCVEKIEKQINFSRDYENLGSYTSGWQNLDSIIHIAASEAVRTGIHLTANLGGYEIFADNMLEMVFFNLFDNALRHGKSVTDIVVSFYDTGDDGVIVFEDNGQGVADDIKEHIFLKGFGSNTGYGLFLIREILDFKGFSIKETGSFGSGARFEIRVPEGMWRLS